MVVMNYILANRNNYIQIANLERVFYFYHLTCGYYIVISESDLAS